MFLVEWTIVGVGRRWHNQKINRRKSHFAVVTHVLFNLMAAWCNHKDDPALSEKNRDMTIHDILTLLVIDVTQLLMVHSQRRTTILLHYCEPNTSKLRPYQPRTMHYALIAMCSHRDPSSSLQRLYCALPDLIMYPIWSHCESTTTVPRPHVVHQNMMSIVRCCPRCKRTDAVYNGW